MGVVYKAHYAGFPHVYSRPMEALDDRYWEQRIQGTPEPLDPVEMAKMAEWVPYLRPVDLCPSHSMVGCSPAKELIRLKQSARCQPSAVIGSIIFGTSVTVVAGNPLRSACS